LLVGCYPPFPDPAFNAATCDFKGHAQCPSQDIHVHAICGYPLDSPFDQYVNEAWWGLLAVQQSVGPATPSHPLVPVDKLTPRLAFAALRTLWAPPPVQDRWLAYLVAVLGTGLALLLGALVAVRCRVSKPAGALRGTGRAPGHRTRGTSRASSAGLGGSGRGGERTPLMRQAQ
jgi:hypothetical protein